MLLFPQDIIKQEEAEAMAKAMAVSSLDSGPSRIPSSDPGDESVIIFTQPEVLVEGLYSYEHFLFQCRDTKTFPAIRFSNL